LVYFKKGSGRQSIVWSQAVDEALCFGWIDSKITPIDGERYEQYFTRRKPRSVWSQINKAKIERLTLAGKMAPAGLAAVEVARVNGSWTSLDEGSAGELSPDVLAALDSHGGANATWQTFPPSFQRLMIEWIAMAKRPETRAKRIAELAEQAALGKKPLRFQNE
jgi:uncharacterized protein YdeI (YjbR/CyaY-like superfamily)